MLLTVLKNTLAQAASFRTASLFAATLLLAACAPMPAGTSSTPQPGQSPTATGPFSMDTVIARAKDLAAKPYVGPVSNLPPEFTSMQFGDYVKIQPLADKFEWRGEKTPFKLGFYHQGMQFNTPIVVHEVVDTKVDAVAYDPERFGFGDLKFNREVTSKLGYAGFKVIYPVNSANKEDELMSVLGASYFRVIGRGMVYGLSARGLAIDTATSTGEEFPRFTEFWVQRPGVDEKSFTFYALLDSPRATGAYKFTLTPGASANAGANAGGDTLLDVQARVFTRGAIGRLGIAPLTSMFLYGPNQQSIKRNFRPAIHDSNGLAIHTASGEWIWRPLNDPQGVEVSTFQAPSVKGFGLLQRGRDFNNYQDLKDRYDLRPSAWIEPQGDWGNGAVQLVEIPTADETNDNIVAYWLPAEMPAAGTPLSFDYRIHWTMDEPAILGNEVGYVRQTFHSAGEQLQSNLIRQSDGTTALMVDFTGAALAKAAGREVKPQVTVNDNADLIDTHLQANPAINGYRLTLRFKVKDPARAVELRAALVSGNRNVTETWSYQLPPRSDVVRSF